MTVGILLAAGAGARFGGAKLLAPLHGRPLVLHALDALRPAVTEIIAVVRPGDEDLAAVLAQAGARVAVCDDACQGMGHSLACGARQVPGGCDVLVALGDMPAVRSATIGRVRAALADGASIAVPCHDGQRGHPVGFSSRLVPDLQSLTGDHGARRVLLENAASVQEIEVDDPGVLLDVDTRGALRRALQAVPTGT